MPQIKQDTENWCFLVSTPYFFLFIVGLLSHCTQCEPRLPIFQVMWTLKSSKKTICGTARTVFIRF